jgi:predicted RNase H-like HicB family nuclease
VKSVLYTVVVHEADEGGCWVEVPALRGCYSQGETVDEALSNVREAIELYLEVLEEEGTPAPRDEEVVYKIAVGN